MLNAAFAACIAATGGMYSNDGPAVVTPSTGWHLHERLCERLQLQHGRHRAEQPSRLAIEGAMQIAEQVRIELVERAKLLDNRAAAMKILRPRVGTHWIDGAPVHRETGTGRSRGRRIATLVGAAPHDFLEAEVVCDLVAFRMEHVAIAVPHLGMLQPFALLLDFIDRRQRRCQVVHRDDAPAAGVVEHLGLTCRAGSPQKTVFSPSDSHSALSPSSIAR